MNDYLSEDLLVPTLPLASKTNRWLASLIDYILYLAVFMLVSIHFGENYSHLVAAVTCFRRLNRPNIGKSIFNIKTVQADGSEASVGNCIVRHIFDPAYFAPFFGIVGLVAASNNKPGNAWATLWPKQ